MQQVTGDPVAPTSVVQRAVKVEAASVVSRHQLHQVSKPGVARPGETGQSHQIAGALWQKGPFFAPQVWHGAKSTGGQPMHCLNECQQSPQIDGSSSLCMSMMTT